MSQHQDLGAGTEPAAFSPEQKEYLSGFGAGLAAARALPVAAGAAPEAEPLWFGLPHDEVTREERLKIERDPLTMWDQMVRAARANEPPRDGDIFRYKYHGLFWVAPAQEAFMVRIKIPGCSMSAAQLEAIAAISDRLADGSLDVTTRGNIQLRGIAPRAAVEVLKSLHEVGLSSRGAGADNIRNVTAAPLAGLCSSELLDTRSLARDMQFYINYHTELFGLPRKFNIAFDGGGAISSVADTNDIGFVAARRRDPQGAPEIVLRVLLAGITGHQRFAVDAGVVVAPEDAVEVAGAMLRVFAEYGDRTSRTKARLCYLLDRIGIDEFLRLTEERLGRPLERLAAEALVPRMPIKRRAHLGVHSQDGRHAYVGLLIVAGRISSQEARAIALAARTFGDGQLRTTVWQNLIVPNVANEKIGALIDFLSQAGLSCNGLAAAGSIVACTGNTGCRFAEADTKAHARAIAQAISGRVHLGDAINVHLTGCPHSCAQHYIGDIGFLGAQLPREAGAARIEGYHVYVGGGADDQQALGRELARDVPATRLPAVVRGLIDLYIAQLTAGESFAQFSRRQSLETLRAAAGLDG